MFHEGQFEGRKVRLPVFLARRPDEPADRVGMVAELRLSAPLEAVYQATVDAIDPVIDAASDTFRVRLVLPNPGNAIPAGIRCSVRLPDQTVSQN